jgi:hypothetical protein
VIEIPEETLISAITEILNANIPPYLLDLEETLQDCQHLPPFQYIGPANHLPPGTSLPYVLLKLSKGSYSIKDRIIKSVIYNVTFTLKLPDYDHVWRYLTAITTVLQQTTPEGYRLFPESEDPDGTMVISFRK